MTCPPEITGPDPDLVIGLKGATEFFGLRLKARVIGFNPDQRT
jgi:hypothetical protein